MKRLMKYFVEGMIFVLPIGVTALVFFKVFTMVDEPLRSIFEFPGLGFLAAVVGTAIIFTLVGFLCSNFLTRGWMAFLDDQFDRFPLVKLLHSSIKDLIGAFVGDKKKFDEPVLVTLPPGGDVKAVGFITRKSLDSWGIADHVAVYLPQSYNFAGNLIVVPKDRVTPLRVPSGEVMAFVVSGGVSGGTPDAPEIQPAPELP